VNHKRVERLMRTHGIVGYRPRRRRSLTRQNRAAPPASDLLGRLFDPDRPDLAWWGDVTWIPTDEGWLYLASVIDLASRHLVGWSMNAHHDAALVVGALEAAVATRGRSSMPDTIFHSDRGGEYASTACIAACQRLGCGVQRAVPTGTGGARQRPHAPTRTLARIPQGSPAAGSSLITMVDYGGKDGSISEARIAACYSSMRPIALRSWLGSAHGSSSGGTGGWMALVVTACDRTIRDEFEDELGIARLATGPSRRSTTSLSEPLSTGLHGVANHSKSRYGAWQRRRRGAPGWGERGGAAACPSKA
jgi:hypothetical protein